MEVVSLLRLVASVSIVLFLRFLRRRSELGGALALLALELRCNLGLSVLWRTELGGVAEDAQPSPLASQLPPVVKKSSCFRRRLLPEASSG